MKEQKKEKSSWGWSIPDDLLEIKELDMYEKVLIAIMGRLGALEKPIYPRHKWLAEKMGMSESGVSKVIKRLIDKEIIIKEGKRWKVNLYSITYPSGRLSPTYQVDDSPTHQVGDKKDIQSKDIQINNISKEIQTKSDSSYGDKDINKVYEFFRETLGGSLDGTIKENRRFAKMLLNRFKKDHPCKDPVELTCELIGVATKDNFHSRNATSFKYLYRNAQKINQANKNEIPKGHYKCHTCGNIIPIGKQCGIC